MTPLTLATLMIIGMLSLIVLRAPVALAMGLAGAVGYIAQLGWAPFAAYMQSGLSENFMSYELAIVPLFLLMGQVATRAGLSKDIFAFANAWLGHMKGGLSIAAVAGCGVFGSICGSSVATASTMSRVALPEMKRFGYSGALSTGSLAAGGTLGILIPPSIVLIIYALITEQNIVKLFLAATVPGIMAIIGFIIAIMIYVRLFPSEAPSQPVSSWRERGRAVLQIWHVLALFTLVLGGIYGGYFTPSEGASVGVIVAILAGLIKQTIGARDLWDCLVGTAGSTAMIFTIIFAADLFNVALALTRMPNIFAGWLSGLDVAPYTVLIIIILFYLVMGCVMDSLSMVLLTVPVLFPAVMALEFGLPLEAQALWFGILTLIVVELGLITPPVGLILFVISGLAKDVPTTSIFRGVLPFIGAETVRVAVIAAFPITTYWLVTVVT